MYSLYGSVIGDLLAAKGTVTMASELRPAPVALPTRQRVAAWIALALALIVPLTVVVNASMTLARIPGAGSDIVVGSLYTIFLCFEWPMPIFAIFLAGMVLKDAKGHNTVAWAAVTLSILTFIGVFSALIVIANHQ
jgi:uncharacterized membrane protein